MIDTTSLKFPSGEFTHTELAKLNGKTNQQVWTRYQLAIKNGQILTAGERKTAGKGKPSRLWKLNPNYVAPVVPATPAVTPATPATPTTAVVTPAATAAVVVPTEPVIQSAGDSVVLPSEDQQEAAADVTAEVLPPVAAVVPDAVPTVETVIDAAVAAIPATPVVETAPVVVAEVVAEIAPALPAVAPVVVVAEVTPEPVIAAVEVATVVNEQVIPDGVTALTEKCPICDNPLFSIPDATGVMVWCAQSAEVCKSAENPAYHAKNAKDAAAGLIERFSKLAEAVA